MLWPALGGIIQTNPLQHPRAKERRLTLQSDYSMVDAALQCGGIITTCVDLVTGEVLTPAPPAGDEDGRRVPGLSKAHISPQAEFWLNGTLITCKKNMLLEPVGGGKRGQVHSFTNASRRRLMYKLGKVDRRAVPLFLTLTYPDQFSDDYKKWARDIDTFRKRFRRKGWAAIWRKEFKTRKTGENAGRVAPHFHLLVWGAEYAHLLAWASQAWYEIVGSGDEKHRQAGTRVEILKNVRGARGYVGKYIGKEDQEDLDAFSVEVGSLGRMWGVINEDLIPWADSIVYEFTLPEAVKLLRLMRRYMRMKKRGNLPSLTLLCNDPEFWFDRLDRLL